MPPLDVIKGMASTGIATPAIIIEGPSKHSLKKIQQAQRQMA